MGRVGAVMETAVSKRAAQTLVEKQEQQRDLDAFGGEAVGVAFAVTFKQAVAFELAQVVAKLVQAVGLFRKLEGVEDDLVKVLGAPAAEVVAPMQQHLQEPAEAPFMKLDPGVVDRADGDRQGEALQKREVHVDVQPLGLQSGETIRDSPGTWRARPPGGRALS